jgi:hypothetical protein
MKVNYVCEAEKALQKLHSGLKTFENIVLKDRQCTYNVILKRVRVTTVTVEK